MLNTDNHWNWLKWNPLATKISFHLKFWQLNKIYPSKSGNIRMQNKFDQPFELKMVLNIYFKCILMQEKIRNLLGVGLIIFSYKKADILHLFSVYSCKKNYFAWLNEIDHLSERSTYS